uniref:Ubiquitin fusion degradation protein UFD1 N-terminal subdomain 1 domain-containing protein n=1 Tax=Solanum lycopersicum TaxID=4081 RepID=K4BI41_SOLLC
MDVNRMDDDSSRRTGFIAEEGIIFMPYWMMQNLCLQEEEGDVVTMKNVSHICQAATSHEGFYGYF